MHVRRSLLWKRVVPGSEYNSQMTRALPRFSIYCFRRRKLGFFTETCFAVQNNRVRFRDVRRCVTIAFF